MTISPRVSTLVSDTGYRTVRGTLISSSRNMGKAWSPASCSMLTLVVYLRYRTAPGTLISSSRDMGEALVTCIVLKPHVTVMDIVSNKMLGNFGFLVRFYISCSLTIPESCSCSFLCSSPM